MLTEAISALREGDLSQTQVARLSDLSRVNARELATAWESIPEGNRVDLVRRFDELSEERVELNFGRALKVALGDRSAVVRQLAVAGLWEDESSSRRVARRICGKRPARFATKIGGRRGHSVRSPATGAGISWTIRSGRGNLEADLRGV